MNITTPLDYQFLVDRARRLSYEYYVLSQPSASDADFDALISHIETIEQQHPDWVLPDSPTQRVGSDLQAGRARVAHRTPMLSCQKASTDNKGTNREKLEAWLTKTERAIGHNHFSYTLEWKYDGISCSLVYLNGQLISAATRGDGRVGQDITAHVQYIQGIPQQLRQGTTYHGRVEVRGEILMPTAHLALTSSNGRPYADCRTATSSLCNQLVPDSSQCALLVFCPWDYDAPLYSLHNSHYESMSLAQCMTFQSQIYRFDATNHAALFECLEHMEAERSSLPFPVDGLVIKVDDKSLAASLGATGHHPKGSIAYKFAPMKATTRCTHIEVTEGKTGRRTPVIYFEPVMLLGRTVRKASVGSESTLRNLGIHIGDTIEVGLANDVRPTIYRVIAVNKIKAPEVTDDAPIEDSVADYADGLANSDCIAEEEEVWLAPSLFSDDIPMQVTSEEECMPEPSTSIPPTTTSTLEKPSSTPSFLSVAFTAVGIIFVGILSFSLAAFGLPLLTGSLKTT